MSALASAHMLLELLSSTHSQSLLRTSWELQDCPLLYLSYQSPGLWTIKRGARNTHFIVNSSMIMSQTVRAPFPSGPLQWGHSKTPVFFFQETRLLFPTVWQFYLPWWNTDLAVQFTCTRWGWIHGNMFTKWKHSSMWRHTGRVYDEMGVGKKENDMMMKWQRWRDPSWWCQQQHIHLT